MSIALTSPNCSSSDALFIYYKVDSSQHVQIAAKLNNMVSEFKRLFPNITLETMKRPEVSSENLETWMEVYRGEGVSENLVAEAIAKLAKYHDLPLPRRVEVFIPLIA